MPATNRHETDTTANARRPLLASSERPIHSDREDALERSRFVRRLAGALIDTKTNRATGIVVGITGPWGSGKSSIMNLLREYIKKTHPHALVVQFDPWLVSGRDDLVAAFLKELVATIRAEPALTRTLKSLAGTFAKYGEQLSPIVNLATPGGGAISGAGFRTLTAILRKDESLAALRSKLMAELDQVAVPITVLIDELDRIEDHEIRTVAQLVRSVADFRGISYVLAYDEKRVVQALGEGVDLGARDERGRAYLEKIVQLQIPLPITFTEELTRLLNAEMATLREELELPAGYESLDRYVEVTGILAAHVLQTPRDIKRFVGTFHALGGMLTQEVDWIDLLAYCALLIKAPRTLDAIRTDPEAFAEDALSVKALARRLSDEKISLEKRLAAIVPAAENNDGIKELLGFLFPTLSGESRSRSEHADALCFRRPLLTTLRLGLIPGEYSRSAIESLVRHTPGDIQSILRRAYDDGSIGRLIDRLDDLYADLTNVNHVAFWKAVAAFLKKPDCEWMTSYQPMHEVIRNFATVMDKAILRDERMRDTAIAVFTSLQNAGDTALTALWLRHHIFVHELYGRKSEQSQGIFLTKEQTEAIARDMSAACRADHMAGRLIPCRWDLQPVYTMVDTGIWDNQCRTALDTALANDRAIDGFTVMLYGRHFSTDIETVKKICDYENYLTRVRLRLSSMDPSTVHETVRAALEKAEGGGW